MFYLMELRGQSSFVFAISFFIGLFLFLPLVAELLKEMGVYGVPEAIEWTDVIYKPKTVAVAFGVALIFAVIVTALIGGILTRAWRRRG
jgi:Na+(H+)/acetate symporter ActP